jgi:copper chaperone CopZ
MRKQTFRVTDLHCSNCVMQIEGLEDALPDVHHIEASYRKGEMVADYDEQQINAAQIQAAVARLGYQATPLERA